MENLQRRARWRAHTAQIYACFFLQRQRHLRRTRFLPTLGHDREIGGMKCASISSGALLAIISSGALMYEFQRKIHAPEFRMQVLQDNAS